MESGRNFQLRGADVYESMDIQQNSAKFYESSDGIGKKLAAPGCWCRRVNIYSPKSSQFQQKSVKVRMGSGNHLQLRGADVTESMDIQ